MGMAEVRGMGMITSVLLAPVEGKLHELKDRVWLVHICKLGG